MGDKNPNKLKKKKKIVEKVTLQPAIAPETVPEKKLPDAIYGNRKQYNSIMDINPNLIK